MSEHEKKPKSFGNFAVLLAAIICIVVISYVLYPKTTLIEFIDASKDYVWVEKKIDSDLGTGWIYNYYNITIPNHEVDYEHHFYAQAFYNKTKSFCDKKPFLNCSNIMMEMIDEGNFRQQAGELNLTMVDRVSDVCFDNFKYIHCKSPKDLEALLVSKGIMNKSGTD